MDPYFCVLPRIAGLTRNNSPAIQRARQDSNLQPSDPYPPDASSRHPTPLVPFNWTFLDFGLTVTDHKNPPLSSFCDRLVLTAVLTEEPVF